MASENKLRGGISDGLGVNDGISMLSESDAIASVCAKLDDAVLASMEVLLPDCSDIFYLQ